MGNAPYRARELAQRGGDNMVKRIGSIRRMSMAVVNTNPGGGNPNKDPFNNNANLLRRRSRANLQDTDEEINSNSPLHYACKQAMKHLVRHLLDAGGPNSNVNALNPRGQTALHCVCEVSNDSSSSNDRRAACLRLLLAWRGPNREQADLDITDDRGFTSLHVAAKSGLKRCVEQLVENGADVLARSDNGRTAYDLAMMGNHKEIAILLRERMVMRTRQQRSLSLISRRESIAAHFADREDWNCHVLDDDDDDGNNNNDDESDFGDEDDNFYNEVNVHNNNINMPASKSMSNIHFDPSFGHQQQHHQRMMRHHSSHHIQQQQQHHRHQQQQQFYEDENEFSEEQFDEDDFDNYPPPPPQMNTGSILSI